MIETQKAIIAAGKKQSDLTKLWSILLVIDDFADNPPSLGRSGW